jgi:hypothetical protein
LPLGARFWHASPDVQKPKMTATELREHLRLLNVASRDDMDELLTDLLCHVYRTKDAQNG